jgi:hypothetical protein
LAFFFKARLIQDNKTIRKAKHFKLSANTRARDGSA